MLELFTPSLEDMWFRESLMADEETMSYNHAWGGTIPFPKERWAGWYDYWIVNHDNQRYYRYLKDDNKFVGEIAYHYDPEYDGYVANVIVFSRYRGKGYGAQGLELLCSAAKENGISVLYDDIAIERVDRANHSLETDSASDDIKNLEWIMQKVEHFFSN